MGLFGPPNVNKLQAKGDVPGLIDALGYEKDPGVRAAAAEALGHIGDPLAVGPLFGLVISRSAPESCRHTAAEALGQIGALAVEHLSSALFDPNPDIREAAARVLGKVGAPAIDSLGAVLEDPAAGVREAAVQSLGDIGDPRAAEILAPILMDPAVGVRQAAAKALAKVGWAPEAGAVGEAYRLVERREWGECVKLGALAVDPLIAALKRRNRGVRRAAAETLGLIADPRAVKPLVAALGDPDEPVRKAATEALVKMMVPAAKPLAAALTDSNPTKRRLAREILDRTGWSPDRNAAGASYWIACRQWANCVEIGARAVTPLVWALENDDRVGRTQAAAALGSIGSPRAVQPLCAALTDQDGDVRRHAASALIALYGSDQLGAADRATILAQRDVIVGLGVGDPVAAVPAGVAVGSSQGR